MFRNNGTVRRKSVANVEHFIAGDLGTEPEASNGDFKPRPKIVTPKSYLPQGMN